MKEICSHCGTELSLDELAEVYCDGESANSQANMFGMESLDEYEQALLAGVQLCDVCRERVFGVSNNDWMPTPPDVSHVDAEHSEIPF